MVGAYFEQNDKKFGSPARHRTTQPALRNALGASRSDLYAWLIRSRLGVYCLS
jgi:hypothetical protein